ncbi:hypothetical protein PUNSTDRAFT_99325 [Punctularia strigosozonata HHB-11173 SS5]|uniref:uncharacterized protein n=1 Tax=Punctularia strigosozonata (strain HHB-11173) TaxID=741275 RepID=UPI00044182D0|nr:uncharacterized protein PUNSTDRAFT_99325 [Punctularia strigosozonata HHB-11173 SS5]EIN11967.1 hypothetical protein PUNSTDRAFT_99325 [Punctularia strigosozonata HHB-11173 SS5]
MAASDAESDYGDDPTVPSATKGQQRLPGACINCKKVKMKCRFPPGVNTCEKCQSMNKECIVEGRKPRTGPNKKEYFQAQLREKDKVIDTLLKQVRGPASPSRVRAYLDNQLHNPYRATPLAVAEYRERTAPRDRSNSEVLSWLRRLQESFQQPFPSQSSPQQHSRNPAGAEGQTISSPLSDSNTLEPDIQTLPDSAVPIGLFADLSLHNKAKRPEHVPLPPSPADNDEDTVGIANKDYFEPGPVHDMNARKKLIEQDGLPDLLVHGVVTHEDVQEIFKVYHTRINSWVPLLDPVIHTPDATFTRSPFLFSVICAVTCRYIPRLSSRYPLAMHFAKNEAANALLYGFKSVELAQAFLIMALYSTPAKRWEEDRGWLYAGLAIGIAVDIGLHWTKETPVLKSEAQDREFLNRCRLWMICFDADRAMSVHWGKPSTIRDNHIIRSSVNFYARSKSNLPSDITLCAYNMMLRLLAEFQEEIYSDPTSPSGLDKTLPFREIALRFDVRLTELYEEWQQKFTQNRKRYAEVAADLYDFRCALWPYCMEYSRLIVLSFAIQQAFERGLQPEDDELFIKSYKAAKAVVTTMTDSIVPSAYIRYAPDGWFNYASFASAFLLKLLRPELSERGILTEEQVLEIFDMIDSLIRDFTSDKVAVDDRHTPRVYGRFLTELVAKHRKERGLPSRQPSERPSTSESSSQGPPTEFMHVFSLQPTSGAQVAYQPPAQEAYLETPADYQSYVQIPETNFPIFENYAPMDFAPSEPPSLRMQAMSSPTMLLPGFGWSDEPRFPTAMEDQEGTESHWQ